MQILWDWADENDICDLKWIKCGEYWKGSSLFKTEGHWEGLPRDKKITEFNNA